MFIPPVDADAPGARLHYPCRPVWGGQWGEFFHLIFVRSRRPIVTLCLASLFCVLAFGLLAVASAMMPAGALGAVALGLGAAGAAAIGIWKAVQLWLWPPGRLALFRDRMVVIQGRHEMRAVWELMESVTLSEPDSWPNVKVTDRLTIQFRNEPPLGFKPAVWHGALTGGLVGRVTHFDNDRLSIEEAA